MERLIIHLFVRSVTERPPEAQGHMNDTVCVTPGIGQEHCTVARLGAITCSTLVTCRVAVKPQHLV